MTRNQASGGVKRAVARVHGRRHSAARTRASVPLPLTPSSIVLVANDQPVTSVVQACCHSWYGTQSFEPSPQSARGVFHRATESRNGCSALAWYCAQAPLLI